MPITLKRWFYGIMGYNPMSMPMVQYWKYRPMSHAAVKRQKDGSVVMFLEGEKKGMPLASVPRGHLMFNVAPGRQFSTFSMLKHYVKNEVYNKSWEMLENDVSKSLIARRAKEDVLPKLYSLLMEMKYDMVPPNSMNPAVREIHRAWTKAAPGKKSYMVRDILCFVLQEDDSYRNRVQWIATHFSWVLRWINPVKCLDKAFAFIEHAEVMDDMKERQRLLRRVTMAMLEDEGIRKAFLAFWRECDWKKVKLTEADKYHFRGKYFKVDFDKFEY